VQEATHGSVAAARGTEPHGWGVRDRAVQAGFTGSNRAGGVHAGTLDLVGWLTDRSR
jgi:hypothetical protein